VVRAPWSVDNRLKYGVVNSLKEMWTSLNARYGEEYEVQVFNYDFRLDVRYNAEQLENYINEQEYTDVVLMGHSNGGPVITAYLARSEANRKKVSKFISFNAPLFGSFSAIGILENIDDMISGIPEGISSAFDVPTIFDKQFKSLVNMYTPYQLLPSYEMFLYEYNGETAGYYLDGERMEFETQEELWEFYCTRPWAKDSEGNLKVPMRDWLEARDCFYVTQADGSKIFASKLVDTVYINGTNVPGGFQTKFVTDPETGKVTLVKQMINTTQGDGTVVTVSAIAGDADPEDIVLFDGWDHYTILYSFDEVLKDATYELVDEMVVEKEAEETKNSIIVTAVAVLLSVVVVSTATLALSLPRRRK
jgi:pimeloyl-ACP methyl ester carboxylesterase